MTVRWRFLVFLTAVLSFMPACSCIAGGVNAPGMMKEPIKINFVISEPCSLVEFINILAGGNHTTEWVKEWYQTRCRSERSMSNYGIILDKYKSIVYRHNNPYRFVEKTGARLELDEKLLAIAADCSTLAELLQKIKSIVKAQDFGTLRTTFEHFEPLYRTLVWEPRLPQLQQQLNEFRREAEATKMAERLDAVKKFLKAPWVKGLPFTIVLVPLPVKGHGTHGQSMGAVQTIELMPGDTFKDQSDVVFHEACHALWFSKRDEESAIRQFHVPGVGVLPRTELYEGMATALGQGWFAEQAFGQPVKSSWYADKTIDRYSRAVFPLYSSYLKSGREIDSEFAKKATLIYFKQFPDAPREIQQTSCYLIVADKISDFSSFNAKLRKALPRLRDVVISFPIDNQRSIKSFKESQAEHAAVLASPTSLGKLSKLGLSSEQIEILKNSNRKNVVLKIGQMEVLFCLAATCDLQEQQLFAYLTNKTWTLPII